MREKRDITPAKKGRRSEGVSSPPHPLSREVPQPRSLAAEALLAPCLDPDQAFTLMDSLEAMPPLLCCLPAASPSSVALDLSRSTCLFLSFRAMLMPSSVKHAKAMPEDSNSWNAARTRRPAGLGSAHLAVHPDSNSSHRTATAVGQVQGQQRENR